MEMPPLLMRSCVLGLCLSVVPACTQLEVRPPPVQGTGFQPTSIELGAHPWYTTVPFSSRWVNHLGERATVTAVRVSRNCTEIDPKAYVGRIIEPGDSLEIAGKLNTGGRPGRHSSEVQLTLASGAIHVLTIAYDTFATYTIQPESLRFERVQVDAEGDYSDAIGTVVFRSDTSTLRRHLVISVPWLEASVVPLGENEAKISVRVVKEYLPHGRNIGTLIATTTDPHRPWFTIPVEVEGMAALRAVPGHVFLDAERHSEAVVRFIDAEGRDVRISRRSMFETSYRDMPFVVMPPFRDEDGGGVRVWLPSDASIASCGPFVVRVADENGNRTRFFVSIMGKLRSDDSPP